MGMSMGCACSGMPPAGAMPAAAAPATVPAAAVPAAAVPAVPAQTLAAPQLAIGAPAQSLAGQQALAAPASIAPGARAAFLPGAMAGPAPQSYLTPAGGYAPPRTQAEFDDQLVGTSIDDVRRSKIGAAFMAAMVQKGIHVELRSDAEFAQMGKANAEGFYDTKANVMVMRREALMDPARRAGAILTLFHEGVHAVDTNAGRLDAGLARGLSRQQVQIAAEARAWMLAGLFARDIGIVPEARSHSLIAYQLGDTAQAYDATFQDLLTNQGYNPTGAKVQTATI